ncbi:MAG: hypothetical protein J7501_10795 [Bdellovibrio sp.]|nr:hypothetical protein [Bdellovibrio sp.]
MEFKKIYKPMMSAFLCTILLSGWTGKEKFVELEGYLNGRNSANFTQGAGNVVKTLNKGTRGEILDVQRLRSGSYGIKIKVLNGRAEGETLWVYHKEGDSELSLFATIPANWDKAQKTRKVATAQAARTEVDMPAAKQVEDNALNSAAIQQMSQAIEDGNQKVGKAEVCNTCNIVPTKTAKKPIIRKGTRSMSNRCSSLMNSQGKMGSDGRDVYEIMSEPRNKQYYTKSSSLGNFCPRFNQLTEDQKLQAWVWFWTALGMEESGCRPNILHGTRYPDGRILNPRAGWGLWTMEKDRNIRRDRGPECSNISTVKGQARCSIEIMKDNQLSRGYDARSGDQKYWGPTKGRRADRQMMPHMKRFVPCFQK